MLYTTRLQCLMSDLSSLKNDSDVACCACRCVVRVWRGHASDRYAMPAPARAPVCVRATGARGPKVGPDTHTHTHTRTHAQ